MFRAPTEAWAWRTPPASDSDSDSDSDAREDRPEERPRRTGYMQGNRGKVQLSYKRKRKEGRKREAYQLGLAGLDCVA